MSRPVAGADCVRRFMVEKQPVRGHWVRLTRSWEEVRAHAHYPGVVSELLGEAVAAAVLLAATLKFRGTLTFQLQGNGSVGLLVAQCTHDFRLRAVARYDHGLGDPDTARRGALFRRLVGTEGRIAVTVEAEERSMRYQGVVPLTGASLGESLEAYFATSEQLPTRVLLAADDGVAGGLLIQRVPEEGGHRGGSEVATQTGEAWEQAERNIGAVTGADLLRCSAEQVVTQVFPGRDLRLFRGTAVNFECRCSQGRVAGLLRALGSDEVRDVLREQGAVTVTCEFCQRPYRFDAGDVEALFAGPEGGSPGVIH
ncbi:MAG: Hsp33 family molecular chaperone HslO [Proteobacteria bacterium]|nr:Hsp33 family molecular chaperone HslO [Pseudomonadota bacterium]